MSRLFIWISLLITLAVAFPLGNVARAADPHDFSRYQVILDRSPFGPVTGAVDTPQPNFAARFTFVGMATTSPNEPMLAIIHDRDRNRVFFRAEGESIDGVNVERIEKSPPRVVLKQGLEVATLTMQPRSGEGMPTMSQPAKQPEQVPGARRIPFRRGG